MNSLRDLNLISNQGLPFVDTRPYSITVTDSSYRVLGANVTYQHVTPVANVQIASNAYPITLPLEISSLISLPNPISISGSVTDGNVAWPAGMPDGVTLTQDFRTFTISNITTLDQWNKIKHPYYVFSGSQTTELPAGSSAGVLTMSYTYPAANSVSVTKNVNHTIVQNNNTKFAIPPAQVYDVNVNKTLTSSPTITLKGGDVLGVEGTLVVQPNVSAAISSISAPGPATTVYDPFTQSVTITGMQGDINRNLANLTITPATDYASPFQLGYVLRDWSANASVYPSPTVSAANIAVSAITHEFTANTFSLTRTYTENNSDLLFPTNTPVIADMGTGSDYQVDLALSKSAGIVGLGESFSSPTGWTSATNTYSYTGTRAQCNTILSTVRFFANPKVTSNFNIAFTVKKGGVTKISKTFKMVGSRLSSIVSGGTTGLLVVEDTNITDLGLFDVKPSVFSSYVIMYQTLVNNSISDAPGRFAGPNSDWRNSGYSTIWKKFTAPTSYTQYLANLAELKTVTYQLTIDYLTAFTLKQYIGVGSGVTGPDLIGGSVSGTGKSITISDQPEYLVTTDYSVNRDWRVPLSVQVADAGANASSVFSVTISSNRNMSSYPVNGPGWFVFTNNNTISNSSVTVSGTKTVVNNLLANIDYYRPLAFNGDQTWPLTYSQTKTFNSVTYGPFVANLTVTPADGSGNVTIATIPTTVNVSIDANTSITANTWQIVDPVVGGNATVGNIGKTYSVSITQGAPLIGKFYLSNVDVGTNVTITGDQTTVNSKLNDLIFACNTGNLKTSSLTTTITRNIVGAGYSQVVKTGTTVFNSVVPPIGSYWKGGYVAGAFSANASGVATHVLLVAPKSSTSQLYFSNSSFSNITSNSNSGVTNTSAMDNAFFPAAKYCADYTNAGYSDWYLPSLYESEVAYYNLKPGVATSSFVNNTAVGTNSYSVPIRSDNYTTTNPAQTTAVEFCTPTGSQYFYTTPAILSSEMHWTSTTESNSSADIKNFRDGAVYALNYGQRIGGTGAVGKAYARPFRREQL